MRQHKPTSKEAEAFIKPHKPTHKQKIKDGLARLRIGGTQEEIAAVCGMRPDQVWKRMIDLQNDGDVFDTGITRKLKSGVRGAVWQLVVKKVVNTISIKTQQQQKASKILKQLSFYERP
jgi:hypothetical protein